MGKNSKKTIKKKSAASAARRTPSTPAAYSRFTRRLWTDRTKIGKAVTLLVTAAVMLFMSSYGVAQWYMFTNRNKPVEFGATFVPDYARYFDLDPQETMQAMIDDLGIRRFRLVSYWDDIEQTPGVYDFSELDWQFKKVESAGGSIALAVGLRQPRWPECHGPDWAMQKPMSEWRNDLKKFMAAVIDRYKNSPALKEYQLENEYFLSVFGECPDFSRERLIDEFKFVKARDPNTPVTISRSNNAIGLPLGHPRPDTFAVSVYKRVWDKTLTKRYFEYPFPAWFYGSLAGWGKIFTGRDLYIHELQTEAWLADGYYMKDAPIDELYKSLNPDRLKNRIKYGEATGMKTIDLWGVEWWYQMKTKRNAPELWEAAKQSIAAYQKR